jgi:hypothetical protein
VPAATASGVGARLSDDSDINWTRMKGKIKAEWGKLTNDQIDRVNGNADVAPPCLLPWNRSGASRSAGACCDDSMHRPSVTGFPTFLLAAYALLATATASSAQLEDWPELHVGLAFGQANVRVDQQLGGIASDLLRDHSAWSFSFGTRPTAWFGAEVAYMDFGRPPATIGSAPNASSVKLNVRQQGLGGFILGFVPLSTATYEPYAKVGYIRLRSKLQASPSGAACVGSGCNGFESGALGNVFAWGGGLQLRLPIDALAVRVEYAQLEQQGARPHLVTAALLWRF